LTKSAIFWILLCCGITSFVVAQQPSPNWYQQGQEAMRQGDFETAERAFLQNQSYQDTSATATAKDRIVAQLLLGDVYRAQRIFEQAFPLYEKAKKLALTAQDSALYLSTCQNIARLYSMQYEPVRAINELKRLLPLAEKLYGKESSAYAGLMMNMGIDYFKICLLYTSPSPRDRTRPRMPSSA